MRIILITILTFIATCIFGQTLTDYVILRSKDNVSKHDTIFGQVDLPADGVFWNVKIITSSGKKKYKTKEVIGLQAGDLYFASIPYGKSYAIVPRLIDGNMDLYFYYTGSDRYKYIDPNKNNYNELALNLIDITWNKTSFFYISDSDSNKYYKIPHSDSKFREQIADIFKDNKEIYNKIINGDYGAKHIPEIVRLYNKSIVDI